MDRISRSLTLKGGVKMTHTLTTSGSFQASEAGALNGHQAVCSCGFVARTSLSERFAVTDLLNHISYMESKTQKRGRR
jgi:hypothetical protein